MASDFSVSVKLHPEGSSTFGSEGSFIFTIKANSESSAATLQKTTTVKFTFTGELGRSENKEVHCVPYEESSGTSCEFEDKKTLSYSPSVENGARTLKFKAHGVKIPLKSESIERIAFELVRKLTND